jgi:uncharacterized protein YijF (DUF1287 family)
MSLAALILLAPIGWNPAAAQEAGTATAVAKLVAAALDRTRHRVTYTGVYRRIPYPRGDVPAATGVCTDVVIRAYRAAFGIDLQRLVHEDMRQFFRRYPNHWGLTRPDPNIDHRRVPNLQVFFKRHGTVLPATRRAVDYRPGDLVTWTVNRSLPHIGIVTDRRSADGKRPMIVHNIGAGPQLEDMLFDYPITGHYRYLPAH